MPNGFLSDINPSSKKAVVAYIDHSLTKTANVYDKFQFERIGFFSVDPDSVKVSNKYRVSVQSVSTRVSNDNMFFLFISACFQSHCNIERRCRKSVSVSSESVL